MVTTARHETRHRPRIVLTLSPELWDDLRDLATRNYRDGKREALRILTEGVERELADRPNR